MAEYDNKDENLRSIDTMEVIMAMGEGPMLGLVDGFKSFYIGDTPLMDNTGKFNYEGVNLDIKFGLGPGEIIRPKLGGISTSTTVNVQLQTGTPVTRRTTKRNISFLEVRLNIQQLVKNNEKGSYETDFKFLLKFKPTNSGTYEHAWADGPNVIHGKTNSSYIREFRFAVPPINDTYDIQVEKVDPPEDDDERKCVVTWESFQEVLGGNWQFPNTTIVQLNTRASNQLSSGLRFYSDWNTKIVRVPTNYNPSTRVYTGVWDGTFRMAYTDNPAWCLYDLVMNDRYGMRTFDQVQMDKWEVYEAARWCDTLVPNGEGGQHPRWTFNHTITEKKGAMDLLRFVAGSFNGTIFDDGNGTAILKVDKPEPAAYLFTPENVVEGRFEYSFSDMGTRYNDITVSFQNPNLNWEEDRRRVFDQAHIDKYGRTPLEFVAVGAIHPQQAIRAARYQLITALTERMSITFKTNRLAHSLAPYKIALIGDPRLGFSMTGRVQSIEVVNRLRLYLRDPIFLETGITYQINFQVPNPNYPETQTEPYQVLTLNVQEGSPRGLTRELLVSNPLPADFPENAVFSLQQTGAGYGLPKPFRVLKVSEIDGDPDNYEVTAVEVNRLKWEYIDNGGTIASPEYSYLNKLTVDPPSKFTGSMANEIVDGVSKPVLTLRWQRSPTKTVREYIIMASRNRQPLFEFGRTQDVQFETVAPPAGLYEFKLYAENVFGVRSVGVPLTFEVVGETRFIPPVAFNGVFPDGGPFWDTRDLNLFWTPALQDPHFLHYELHFYTPPGASGGTLVATYSTTQPRFTWTFEENKSKNAGNPIRFVFVYVRQVDKNRNKSDWRFAQFANHPPTVPTGITAETALDQMSLRWSPNPEADVAGYRVWSSSTSGFTPGPTNRVYDGPGTTVTFPFGGTRFFKMAAYDIFDNSVDMSTEFPVGAPTHIGPEKIVNDAITRVIGNTLTATVQNSSAASFTLTKALGSILTASNGQGRVLIQITPLDIDYLARGVANSAGFSDKEIEIIIRRVGGPNLYRRLTTQGDSTPLIGFPPPCLTLLDLPGVNVTASYEMVVRAASDQIVGRTLTCETRAMRVILTEFKR